MRQANMNRRRFLAGSSAAIAGSAWLTVMGGVVIGPNGAWALAPTTISAAEAATLVEMTRALYPHEKLDDAIYGKVVATLDEKAGKDAALKESLQKGVADLQAANWSGLNADQREEALKKIETSAFFQSVRGECVTGIYNNPDVWKIYGYEGASAELGGYLHRGFNEITWPDEI
ncbi:hypothetical protein [Dongia sp.]|uniref:hypothetical protein n=1 Tax=Dongia sp. TaxID=1977262 RepID=UPI0035ADB806